MYTTTVRKYKRGWLTFFDAAPLLILQISVTWHNVWFAAVRSHWTLYKKKLMILSRWVMQQWKARSQKYSKYIFKSFFHWSLQLIIHICHAVAHEHTRRQSLLTVGCLTRSPPMGMAHFISMVTMNRRTCSLSLCVCDKRRKELTYTYTYMQTQKQHAHIYTYTETRF